MPLRHLRNPEAPAILRGPVIVDAVGLPRYWAAVWATIEGAHLAPATLSKKLRHIEDLYQHGDSVAGINAVDDAIGASNTGALSTILESWFLRIRSSSHGRKEGERRWQTGYQFVTRIVTLLTSSHATGPAEISLDSRLHRLAMLYGQLHVRVHESVETIRSLPASVVQALYSLLDPAAPHNPFNRERTRWRVFVAFVLLLHQGLRRGELLCLPVDAVRSGYDASRDRIRHWVDVRRNPYVLEDADSRHTRPSLKNSNAVRQLPVSEVTAHVVQTYVENYRGRPVHPWLLNSQENKPLSAESLTKLFAQITLALPPEVIQDLKDRTGKTSVTPHDLRHTCAVVRLNQLLERGDSMDEALQKLRTFFGWSRTSTMPSRYARAVFEDRLSGVWNNAFDERAAMLRSLPRGH